MIPLPLRVIGTLALIVAVVMSVMLSLEHLSGLSLPGCGEGSGCAEAAKSVWARVPGVQWPVAYLGLTYFLALLVFWLGSPRGLPALARAGVRLGLLISIGFTIIMFVEGHVCQYCVACHAANFVFWLVMECARARGRWSMPALGTACTVYVLGTVVLAGFEWHARYELEKRGEQELQEATQKIIAATTQNAAAASQSQPVNVTATGPSEDDGPLTTAPAGSVGFRGRYLQGPEKAAVRLVIFTDYQCRDCRRIEGEIRTLLAKHKDVSFSVKQAPFDQSCNQRATRTLHSNACWAARAAEAAGILWGDEGFFAMHEWLFDHSGVFTSTEALYEGIRSLGYDPEGFVEIMTGSETLRRVQADIAESEQLGLFQTPMIFINGVELRGWYAQNAVVRAAEAVLATHPEPRDHSLDQPPQAIEKCVGDWREQPLRHMPVDQTTHALGQTGGQPRVTVVIFGDYQEPTTAEADNIVREWLAGRDDTYYAFRHYPFDQSCNPNVSRTGHDRACWAARVAEAAAVVGGEDAYWRVHDWLLGYQDALTDEALGQAAADLGLDAAALRSAMDAPEVTQAIEEDVNAGKVLNLRFIPAVFIDGRPVLRWRFLGLEEGRKIIRSILDAAAED
jgi:protein-disulfide isomerase/uncharacterized membrane protein